MTWRTASQRMVFLAAVAGIVAALILLGAEPYFALSAASTIAFIARDLWTPGGDAGRGALTPGGGNRVGEAGGGGESDAAE